MAHPTSTTVVEWTPHAMNTTDFPPPRPSERLGAPARRPGPLDVPRGEPAPTPRPPVPTPSPSAAPRSPSWIVRLVRPLASARTWKETLYLLLDLPVGIATFTTFVALLSVGFGLIIGLVGVAVLLAAIYVGRLVGTIERARARLLLGLEAQGRPMPDLSGDLWDKFKAIVADGPGWGGIGYGIAMLPWGIATFVVTTVGWSIAVGGLTMPLLVWGQHLEIAGTVVGPGGKAAIAAGAFVVGALLTVAMPRVVHGLANADRWLVRTVLSQSREEELASRVSELTVSRDASVDSAAAELRRIERDLHDGAQQRLVALAMDLGLARERLASGADPERAAELVARAHEESKQAIVELRELVRGIHPSVLTDRGLDAALSALAARSPVPVDVEVELRERLPAAIEAAAYFVVAEALTNVAKHSGASAAWVRVTERAGPHRIVVEVRDDGHGGATFAAGGGLVGLRDRVLAVEGRLRIASPAGGPTMLVAELPCAS